MCDYVVNRAAADLPQNTTSNLFVVSGGRVLVLGLIGEIAAEIQAQTTGITATAGGTNGTVTLISDASLSSLATGILVGVSSETVGSTGEGVRPALYDGPAVLSDGASVQWHSSQSSTGQMSWTLWYRPLDPAAKVEAA